MTTNIKKKDMLSSFVIAFVDVFRASVSNFELFNFNSLRYTVFSRCL